MLAAFALYGAPHASLKSIRIALNANCERDKISVAVTATNLGKEDVYVLSDPFGPDGKESTVVRKNSVVVIMGKLEPPDPHVLQYIDGSGGKLVKLRPKESISWRVLARVAEPYPTHLMYELGYFPAIAQVIAIMQGRDTAFVNALAVAPTKSESPSNHDRVIPLPKNAPFLYRFQKITTASAEISCASK